MPSIICIYIDNTRTQTCTAVQCNERLDFGMAYIFRQYKNSAHLQYNRINEKDLNFSHVFLLNLGI